MAKKKIGDYVAEWMESFGAEHGYELHRTEFQKEGSAWYLSVYVDKLENGEYVYMSSDDCKLISDYLSECLDREDPIQQAYYLEVSSPGLDRPLISEKDFKRFAGSLVELKLYKPQDGSKEFSGELVNKEGDAVTIKTDEGEQAFSLKDIAKINLAVVF